MGDRVLDTAWDEEADMASGKALVLLSMRNRSMSICHTPHAKMAAAN